MAFNHKQTINIKTKDVSDIVEKVHVPDKGGSIRMHVYTNNAEREGTTTIDTK